MKLGIEFGSAHENHAQFVADSPALHPEFLGLGFELDEADDAQQLDQTLLLQQDNSPQHAKHITSEIAHFVKDHPGITLIAGIAAVITATRLSELAHRHDLSNSLPASV